MGAPRHAAYKNRGTGRMDPSAICQKNVASGISWRLLLIGPTILRIDIVIHWNSFFCVNKGYRLSLRGVFRDLF